MRSTAAPLLLLGFLFSVESFQPWSPRRRRIARCFSTPSDVEDADDTAPDAPAAAAAAAQSMILECAISDENEALKRDLIKMAASFDRGFGASGDAREKAASIVDKLEQGNMAEAAAATILSHSKTSPSLEGTWRMIWTTAVDVLLLQLSPLFSTGAIHQVFDAETKVVTNVIDFQPRAQTLLPIPASLIRAKVQTRACQPSGVLENEYPNRVGLIFEAVSVKPQQVFGMDGNMLPPLAFDLPKLPGTDSIPGYFDVTYLDTELLIIRQNAPGGMFALLRVDSIDP